MPDKSKKIKEMGYEGGYPMMGDKPANMMKPYQMGHSPKEMKYSSMPMKGHGKATKAGRPSILDRMS